MAEGKAFEMAQIFREIPGQFAASTDDVVSRCGDDK
jgi:hypothetical protein